MYCSSSCPIVSCIIPLYNKAPYICRAIDSILHQTIQNFEIIVVNDGSTDGSEKIVEKYTDTRIRLINQKNQGVSAARNMGVLNAKADFVAFLDADDEWLPEFLETVFKLRKKWPNAGLYGTRYASINQKDQTQKITHDTGFSEDGLIENYFQYINIYKYITISSSALMIQKEIFSKYNGYDVNIRYGEDRDLYCRIALNYPFAYSPKVMNYCYYNSINNSYYTERNTDTPFLKCVSNDGNCIVNHPYYPDIRTYVDGYLISIVLYNISQQKPASISKAILGKVKNRRQVKWILTKLLIYMPVKLTCNTISFIKKRHLLFKIEKRLLSLL